jgi:S1-C subfamily serine protease
MRALIGASVILSVAIVGCPEFSLAQADSLRGLSVLQLFERDLRHIVNAVAPSLVTVRGTQSVERVRMSHGMPSPSMSVGSGIVLDSAGMILTCSRVVEGSDDFWVETADGRLFQAALLGSSDEVAVLQIKVVGLRPPLFGDAVDLGVGSLVGAIGNSYGYSGGVSWGEVNGFRPDGTIQLSLGVAPGSTGGALINSRGEVVGLIKAKISEPFYLDPLQCQTGKEYGTVTVPGRRLELPTSSVSLAVPIQAALRVAQRVIATGAEPRAYVGVYVEDLTGWYVAHFKTSEGVLVSGVVEKTPAQQSGLLEGDVITAVDRQKIRSVRHFRQIVGQGRPGQRMLFDLIRGGRPLKLMVELGRADAPNLGVIPKGSGPANPNFVGAASDQMARPAAMTPLQGNRAAKVLDSPQTRDSDGLSAIRVADFERRLLDLQRTADSLKQELLRLHQTRPR